MRRSTLESIKDAIEKSPNYVSKLVNVDSLEKKNIGQHFKVLTADSAVEMKNEKMEVVEEKVIEKRDLQTQTSFLLEKLYT